MGHVIKENLMDHSTPGSFCFSMRCAQCGEELKSTAVRFSRSGMKPNSSGKRIVYDALYRREKQDALSRAEGELSASFNLCPICRRTVCDHCFLLCDDIDMCASCAENLHEEGEPVLQRGLVSL